MSQGTALTDEDRWDWLAEVARITSEKAAKNSPSQIAIASCSALAVRYRNFLRRSITEADLIFVFLYASESELYSRTGQRQGHYMTSKMVASQLATMEVPKGEELVENHGDCLAIEAIGTPESIVAKISNYH